MSNYTFCDESKEAQYHLWNYFRYDAFEVIENNYTKITVY